MKIDFKVNQITTGSVRGTDVVKLSRDYPEVAQFINDNLGRLYNVEADREARSGNSLKPPKIYNLVIPLENGLNWTILFNEIYVHEE